MQYLNSSSAHCCEGESLNSIRINIGDHLWQEGDEESYKGMQQILIHPEYRRSVGGLPYDFCMIQTKQKMVIDGDKTQVACFPEAGTHVDGNEAQCWTAGWGRLSYGGDYPFQLQTVKVNVYDEETCYKHMLNYERDPVSSTYNQFFNSEVEFCAGHYNVTTNTYPANGDSCQGDSGGPLGKDRLSFINCYTSYDGFLYRMLTKDTIPNQVCINPNSTEPKLYGVTSWGIGCGSAGFYAKVSAVIDWLDDVITREVSDDSDCKFYQDGNLTVFETPSPYFDNMRCTQNVTCPNPTHTVHYKFEYFETEYGYDELYVNEMVYQGYNVPTYKWIDSFSSSVDLIFTSDSSYAGRGFKMNLKCAPGPCDGSVCQMPEDVVSPGNKWFINDLSENDTDRKRRSLNFEDGVLAREASWPWVVGITSAQKLDYCHVEIVTTESLCGPWNDFTYSDTINYAQLEDIIQLDNIKEAVEKIVQRYFFIAH